ncbi:MAG: hypothetical protein HC888_00055 [Candidatus Competibacteraceae bacterium]|nr:hypothetical protein [Candidatus Competibacteraceae bacterium]
MPYIITNRGLEWIIDDLRTDVQGGTEAHIYLRLFTAGTPSVNTVWGDLTEANFSGYNGLLLSPSNSYYRVGNIIYQNFHPCNWQHNGSGVANTVLGYMITMNARDSNDNSGTRLLAAENVGPFPMSNLTHKISINIRMAIRSLNV